MRGAHARPSTLLGWGNRPSQRSALPRRVKRARRWQRSAPLRSLAVPEPHCPALCGVCRARVAFAEEHVAPATKLAVLKRAMQAPEAPVPALRIQRPTVAWLLGLGRVAGVSRAGVGVLRAAWAGPGAPPPPPLLGLLWLGAAWPALRVCARSDRSGTIFLMHAVHGHRSRRVARRGATKPHAADR
jgi:hypothetical protein